MPGVTLAPDLAQQVARLTARVERMERATKLISTGTVFDDPTEAEYEYGELLAPGSIVYIRSDGTVANASAQAGGNFPAFGLCLETGSAGTTHRVLLFGAFTSSVYSWTIGGLLWLSTTAGGLTQTQPSGTDQCIQPMGWAIDTQTIFFRPDITWLTHV